MLLKNSTQQYGFISIILHWVIAVLIIFLLAFGIYMTRIPISPLKLKLYGWHKEIGFLVLLLAFVRLIWRTSNPTPSLGGLVDWERFSARLVHWVFYFFMFALPLTGWLVTSASDLPMSFFGLFVVPNLIPANETQRLVFSELHKYLGYFLIFFIGLHTAAALKHHFINRDNILRRMLWPS